ncbi:hypothetical protein, partial [Escherichia fergusonii]|uniref:hypothetical protein n=1 Tax=Escherichia fergusonii TaxID=564 RepID=UPI001C5CB4C4
GRTGALYEALETDGRVMPAPTALVRRERLQRLVGSLLSHFRVGVHRAFSVADLFDQLLFLLLLLALLFLVLAQQSFDFAFFLPHA